MINNYANYTGYSVILNQWSIVAHKSRLIRRVDVRLHANHQQLTTVRILGGTLICISIDLDRKKNKKKMTKERHCHGVEAPARTAHDIFRSGRAPQKNFKMTKL